MGRIGGKTKKRKRERTEKRNEVRKRKKRKRKEPCGYTSYFSLVTRLASHWLHVLLLVAPPHLSVPAAFEAWRAARGSLVGFAPRLHSFNPTTGQYAYQKRGWVWYEGMHSLMLTKGKCIVRPVH